MIFRLCRLQPVISPPCGQGSWVMIRGLGSMLWVILAQEMGIPLSLGDTSISPIDLAISLKSDGVMGIYKNFMKGPALQTTIQLLSRIATHIAPEGGRMIRFEKFGLLLFSVTMFSCGSMSTPKTATGTWRAVMTSTTTQAGQPGEQAVLLVTLQQHGKSLNATVSNVLQESSCLPTGTLRGTTLNGQVILPGGEAMSNLQLSGSLNPSGGIAIMLSMTGAMQPDANSSAGTFTVNPNLSGCAIGTGTFEMTRMPLL
jgi:hypothetical protein